MKFLNFEINLIVQKSERESGGRGKNSQRALQDADNRQQKRFWQCVYAALSLTCVSVFIAILLFRFLACFRHYVGQSDDPIG